MAMRSKIRRSAAAILFCVGIVTLTLAVRAQNSSLRSLTIVTAPEASVWIDDVNYGKTDAGGKLALKTFATGAHKIRVRANGFKEVSQNLPPAQTGELKIELAKTTDQAEIAFQEAEEMAALDREKAAELYKKAVRLRPKYPEAFLGLARTLAGMGEHSEALKAIQSARRARPAYAEASAVEGRIYKEMGNETKAIASFKRAVTEGKGYQPEALTGLGLLYKDRAEAAASETDFEAEKQNYMLAAAELKKAAAQLAGAPDAVVIYQQLGDAYERAKMYPEAIRIYEEFLRAFPELPEAETFRSFIVQIQKRMKEEQ